MRRAILQIASSSSLRCASNGCSALCCAAAPRSAHSVRFHSDGAAAGAASSSGGKKSTVDVEDVKRLSKSVSEWWDPKGPFSALHSYNPVRVKYMRDQITRLMGRDPALLRPFEGLDMLDIGCGGGILAESLARLGGNVTGVDASETNIESATYRLQQQHKQLRQRLNFVHATAEDLQAQGKTYDVVIASEVIEHVSDAEHFLTCMAQMTRPGGVVLLSTFNKTVVSYLLGIFVAENILGVAPKGAHDWNKFLAPETIEAILQGSGVQTVDVTGVLVLPDPLTGSLNFSLSTLTGVNYMLTGHKVKPAEENNSAEEQPQKS